MEMQETEADRAALKPLLMTLRVIVFALIAGPMTFQLVILFLKGPAAFSTWPKWDVLEILAAAMAVSNLVLSFVMPALTRSAVEKSPGNAAPRVRGIAQQIQTETIVSCALLEGAAFLNLVVVFLQGSLPHAVIANVLLLFLLGRFPVSEEAYFANVERRLREWRENIDRGE